MQHPPVLPTRIIPGRAHNHLDFLLIGPTIQAEAMGILAHRPSARQHLGAIHYCKLPAIVTPCLFLHPVLLLHSVSLAVSSLTPPPTTSPLSGLLSASVIPTSRQHLTILTHEHGPDRSFIGPNRSLLPYSLVENKYKKPTSFYALDGESIDRMKRLMCAIPPTPNEPNHCDCAALV